MKPSDLNKTPGVVQYDIKTMIDDFSYLRLKILVKVSFLIKNSNSKFEKSNRTIRKILE
ncbi:MAG: hypothetical protein IJU90_00105 [Bacteroidales bacterium]|nr:hypothetical protein [Bacteroidales bacterium]